MALSYLALGDSYTIGEGVEPAARWPLQLVAGLRDISVAVDDPQIIATTGWTTDELEAGIDAAAPQGPFGLVSLLIGVNDQYRGRSVDDYRPRFTALLQRALGFAGDRAQRVLVLSIPDWGVTRMRATTTATVCRSGRSWTPTMRPPPRSAPNTACRSSTSPTSAGYPAAKR